MNRTLAKVAAVSSIISAGYLVWMWMHANKNQFAAAILGNQSLMKTDIAATVIPSQYPTDPGFSQFARRSDLDAPLDLADQPLLKGQAVPT